MARCTSDRCRSQFKELIGQRDCSESAGQPCRQGGRHQQQPAPPEVSLAVMTTLRAEVDVKKKAIAQSLVNLPQRERLFTHPLNDNQNMVTLVELQKWRTVHARLAAEEGRRVKTMEKDFIRLALGRNPERHENDNDKWMRSSSSSDSCRMLP